MKSMKIKLIVSNLLLLVAVALLVGTTLAYFTDTKTVSNTLTAGTVKIELTEAKFKKDAAGNLVQDTEAPRFFGTADSAIHDYGTVWPGQSIFKDPTIHNIGENDAWIAVEVALDDGAGNLANAFAATGSDVFSLFSGAVLDETFQTGVWNGLQNVRYNDNVAIVTKKTDAGYSIYFLFNTAFTKGQKATVFDHLEFPASWTANEMRELSEFKIHVHGYAVQTHGFATCYDAMTGAFADYFDFN